MATKGRTRDPGSAAFGPVIAWYLSAYRYSSVSREDTPVRAPFMKQIVSRGCISVRQMLQGQLNKLSTTIMDAKVCEYVILLYFTLSYGSNVGSTKKADGGRVVTSTFSYIRICLGHI